MRWKIVAGVAVLALGGYISYLAGYEAGVLACPAAARQREIDAIRSDAFLRALAGSARGCPRPEDYEPDPGEFEYEPRSRWE